MGRDQAVAGSGGRGWCQHVSRIARRCCLSQDWPFTLARSVSARLAWVFLSVCYLATAYLTGCRLVLLVRGVQHTLQHLVLIPHFGGALASQSVHKFALLPAARFLACYAARPKLPVPARHGHHDDLDNLCNGSCEGRDTNHDGEGENRVPSI